MENLTTSKVNPKRKALYDGLKTRGLYSKSFEDFENQFSTPEKIQALHKSMKDKGLYTKELPDFEAQFYSDKKKVDTIASFTGLPESLPEDPLTKNIQASEKLNSSLPEQNFNEQADKNRVLAELAEDAQAQENFRKLYESSPETVEGFLKAAPDLLKDLVRNRSKSPEQIREDFESQRKALGDAESFVSGIQDKAQFEDKDRWDDNALTKGASATGAFNKPIISMASSIPKFAGIATNALERLTNMALGKEAPDIEGNSFYKLGKWMDDKALEIGVTATDPRLDDSFLLNDIPSGLGSVASILATGNFGAASGIATQATKFGAKEALKETAKAITKRPTLASGNMMGVDEFEQAIASGQSEGKSLINYFGGLGAGFTETIPLERALTRINKITGGKLVDIAKAGTVGALEEMTQEGIQQYITNKVAQGTYDPERDLFQDVWRSMRAGGAIGLLLPGIGVAMRSMSPEQRAETKSVLNKILREKANAEGIKVETPDGVLGNDANAQKQTPDEAAQGQPVPSQAKQEADNTGGEKQGAPADVAKEPVDSGAGKKAGEAVELDPKTDPVKRFTKEGGNTMVKEDGQPMTVFHGTDKVFDKFSKDKKGSNTGFANTKFGFFFLADENAAKDFARDNANGGENIISANIDLKKPVDLTNKGIFGNKEQAPAIVEIITGEQMSPEDALAYLNDEIDLGDLGAFRDVIETENGKEIFQKYGYDGVISTYGDNMNEYVVFEPEQINILKQSQKDGAGVTRKVDKPIQQDAAGAEKQGDQKPVQQGPTAVRQGEAEAATPVLDKKAKALEEKRVQKIKEARKARLKITYVTDAKTLSKEVVEQVENEETGEVTPVKMKFKDVQAYYKKREKAIKNLIDCIG